MTVGKLLFYGGIIGLTVALLLFIFIFAILKNKKKNILKKLEENY